MISFNSAARDAARAWHGTRFLTRELKEMARGMSEVKSQYYSVVVTIILLFIFYEKNPVLCYVGIL